VKNGDLSRKNDCDELAGFLIVSLQGAILQSKAERTGLTRKALSTWPFTTLRGGVLRCTSAVGCLSTCPSSRSSKPYRFAKMKLFIRKVRISILRTESVT
jgi:hypothetical protein